MPSALFLLRPLGALHFGAHPEDLSAANPFPAADTLFGAMAWAVSALEGEEGASAWVDTYVGGGPPFLISSALPCLRRPGAGGWTPCVPMPNRRPDDLDSDERDPVRAKDFKRATHVEAGFLHDAPQAAYDPRLAASGIIARRLPAVRQANRKGGTVLPPPPPPFGRLLRPGVRIDRQTSASEPYATRATFYSEKEMRLGVCAWSESEAELAGISRLLTVLGASGIGGGKSRGMGRFELEGRQDIPFRVTPDSKGPLLSPVILRPDSAADSLQPPDGHGYRIVERRSWIASPAWNGNRARSVNMVAEGSYLAAGLRGPVGMMADVTPASPGGRHRVFRYGYGLFLDEGEARP